MATRADLISGRISVDRLTDEWADAPLSVLRFTFDIDAGALRRGTLAELVNRLAASGLDVSWTDRRSGWLGTTRRFTVEGSRALVDKLIRELAASIGWAASPGFSLLLS